MCVIMSINFIFIFFKQMVIKNIYSGSVYKQTYTCICPYIYTLYINQYYRFDYKHENAGI